MSLKCFPRCFTTILSWLPFSPFAQSLSSCCSSDVVAAAAVAFNHQSKFCAVRARKKETKRQERKKNGVTEGFNDAKMSSKNVARLLVGAPKCTAGAAKLQQ